MTAGDARAVRESVVGPCDGALVGRVGVEGVADEAGAAGGVHEFVLEPDQAARRDPVFEPDPAHAVRLHVDELRATFAERPTTGRGALRLSHAARGDQNRDAAETPIWRGSARLS